VVQSDPEFTPGDWRDFPEVLAESLWTFDSRSAIGKELVDYHGAFIPQIPEQFITRFTQPGDLVIDPMCGSGTTLAVAKKLGREALGIDISEKCLDAIKETIQRNGELGSSRISVIQGDICSDDIVSQIRRATEKFRDKEASLLMYHPPYFNIIKFTEDDADLSRINEMTKFLDALKVAFGNTLRFLKKGGIVAVVIGDVYYKSAWFPLALRVLDQIQSSHSNLSLRGIIVKNMANSRAKRHSSNLWRYRSFRNQTYLFSHEYILVLRREK
jgi:DNA modification methylase